MASCLSAQAWRVGRVLQWGDATVVVVPLLKVGSLKNSKEWCPVRGAQTSAFGKRKASPVPGGWLQASVSPLFRIEDNQRCLFMTLFIGDKFAWMSKHTQLIISACVFSTGKQSAFWKCTDGSVRPKGCVARLLAIIPHFGWTLSPPAWLLGNKLPPFSGSQLSWFWGHPVPLKNCSFVCFYRLFVLL